MNVVAANFNQCSSVRFVPFGFVLQQQDPATKNHGHNHATRRGREESVHFATLQMRKEVSLHGFPQITYLFFQLLSVVLFHNSFLHHKNCGMTSLEVLQRLVKYQSTLHQDDTIRDAWGLAVAIASRKTHTNRIVPILTCLS